MNQPEYNWLLKETAPKMIVEASKLLGIHEITGQASNPVIMAWAKETGLAAKYSNDEIPWCGLFMAVVAKRAGKGIVTNPLWALNWQNFGVRTKEPMFGDILVFKRPTGGHVGLYVGEDNTAFHVLGGNTGNEVKVARIEKLRLYAARRPEYNIGQPVQVRKIFLSDKGALSTNES